MDLTDEQKREKAKRNFIKSARFNKLDEWEKRAIKADAERRAELNKQYQDEHQNPYSKYAKALALTAGVGTLSNILMHRTGLHQKLNKPLARIARTYQMSKHINMNGKYWHSTTISDWEKIGTQVARFWEKTGKDTDGNIRIDLTKKNSYISSIVQSFQMKRNADSIANAEWVSHLEAKGAEIYEQKYSNGDKNRKHQFDNFIRDVARANFNRKETHKSLRKNINPQDDSVADKIYQDLLDYRDEKQQVKATKEEIANNVPGLMHDPNDPSAFVIEKTREKAFKEKAKTKVDTYSQLIDNVEHAAEHFGEKSNKNIMDHLRGTRKATMQDLLDSINSLEDVVITTNEKTNKGQSYKEAHSLKDIITKARERAKEVGRENEFLSITPDEALRIGIDGKLYSAEGTETFTKELLESASSTLPGKILKLRDMIAHRDQPAFNIAFQGSLDPVLAAATNNTIDSKKQARLDNTIVKAYDRWYKIEDDGKAQELEFMHNKYDMTSGRTGFAYKQLHLMHDDARQKQSDNAIFHALDIREDRDEFGNKSFVGKLMAHLPGYKDENSRNKIFENASSGFSEEAMAEYAVGMQAINNGHTPTYAYEIAAKMDIISQQLQENTYELSTNVVEKLMQEVGYKNDSVRLALEALSEKDNKIFLEKAGSIQTKDISGELYQAIDPSFSGWTRRRASNHTNAANEYSVITGREHGVIGSDFSTQYGNESLQGAQVVRKLLGQEALLQIGLIKAPINNQRKSIVDKISEDSYDYIFDVLNNLQGISKKERQNAKNLATSAIWNVRHNSEIKDNATQQDMIDFINDYYDFANTKGQSTRIDEMHKSLKNIKDENFTDFDTYYTEADEVGNPLQYNNNITIRKTTGVIDVLKSLNDVIRNKANATNDLKDTARNLVMQNFAGRNNMEDVSYVTLFPYFGLTRLNEVGQIFGIGFSSRNMASSLDIVKNIMTKRVIPVAIASTYLDWGNDTTQEITGQSFAGAAARGLAQTDVMFRRGMDMIGLTDWLKKEKEINPIMQYWGDHNEFYNADELQDYYDNGYTPVRKGAFWTFGSVNELRGSEISYWAPTWVRKFESDYKDKALYGDYFHKWSHSILPTPINPLSPIMGILDPYWLEKDHAEDRPYPVSGQLFNEGTPLGIVANPIIGNIIKPQKNLHPDRLQNGVDIYSSLHALNDVIRDKAASIGKRNYFTYDRNNVAAVSFNAWNAPDEDTSVFSLAFKAGQYGPGIEQTYAVYNNTNNMSVNDIYASKTGIASINGGFAEMPDERDFSLRSISYDAGVSSLAKDTGYTQLTKDNASEIISTLELDNNHALITGKDNTFAYIARERKPDLKGDEADFKLEESLEMDSVISNSPELSNVAQLVRIAKHPMDNLLDLNTSVKKQAKAKAKTNTISESDFDENQGFLTAQKLKHFAPSQGMALLNDADTVAELINQGKGSSLVHDLAVSERLMTGIYGYMTGELFGIGTDQEKRIATSQDITSTSRAFWDTGVGGAGGSTAEIIRRFIPDYRRRARVNPMLNKMPEWMPDRFKYGDPYTSVIDGEARLPGKGYEALNKLHPDAYGDYGAFDRFKILADIAPFSPEYKLWKQIASKTVADPYLIEEMDEIRERVSQQGRKHDFYDYNLSGHGVIYKDVVVSSLMDYGKFRSGNAIYKLAGVSIQSNGDNDMQETLGKYLRVGDTVTVAIDQSAAYRSNKDSNNSISAAVYRNGENVSQQMLESGDARIRKGDTSAPAYLTRYSPTQRAVAEISELISHVDIPWLSDQYLRVRSPLESYDAEVLYGTPYQTWSHPIDTFVAPAIRRAMSDVSPLQYGMLQLFNYVSDTPGTSKPAKIAATAAYMFTNRGAFIGGALGSIAGLRQGTIEKGARLGQVGATIGHLLTGGNSYLDMISNGAIVGYEIAERLEKSKGKGALIGAFVSALYRDLLGSKGTWKPEYVQQKWALDEYFDRLTYIKYTALYNEAARKAKDEEGVNIDDIIKRHEEQFEIAKDEREKLTKIQETLKRKISNMNSFETKEVSEAVEQSLEMLKRKLELVDTSNKEIFEGGEWTRTALLYRKATKSTVYALDEYSSWSQMISALPTGDREYFMEFVKERDQGQREKILDHVSPSLRKALKLAWGKKESIKKVEDNETYFKNHNLPTPYWAGWDPNVDLDDIELKTVKNEGMNLSDFGYYESRLENEAAQAAPPVKDWSSRNSSAKDVERNMKRILNGKGLKNVDISVEPGIGGTSVIASIKKWAGIKENKDRIEYELKGMAV